MFCENLFDLASVHSLFQQKKEMEQCILFPVPSDIWCSSDLRILLFQSLPTLSKWKISQMKIGNSRDSWGLCHTPLSSLFPSISQFSKKYQKYLSRETIGGDLPDVLENTLSFYSCPTGIPPVGPFLVLPTLGKSWSHPALPGVDSWGFVSAIKHRNKKENSFPPVPDIGMEQSRSSTKISWSCSLFPSLLEWFMDSVVL